MSSKDFSSSIFQSVTITHTAPAAKNARERPVKVNETQQLCFIRKHRDQVLIFRRDFPQRDTFIQVFQAKSFISRKLPRVLIQSPKALRSIHIKLGPGLRENEKLKLQKSYKQQSNQFRRSTGPRRDN